MGKNSGIKLSKKEYKVYSILLVAIVLVVLLQFGLSYVLDSYEGTDDQAVGVIESIQPGYEPWFESLWEPESALGETMLFSLQMAIGVGTLVLAYLMKLKKSTQHK